MSTQRTNSESQICLYDLEVAASCAYLDHMGTGLKCQLLVACNQIFRSKFKCANVMKSVYRIRIAEKSHLASSMQRYHIEVTSKLEEAH